MTREQIADGLTQITLKLANENKEAPEGWTPHEWAYVKGIAAGEIMRLRDRLVATGVIGLQGGGA